MALLSDLAGKIKKATQTPATDVLNFAKNYVKEANPLIVQAMKIIEKPVELGAANVANIIQKGKPLIPIGAKTPQQEVEQATRVNLEYKKNLAKGIEPTKALEQAKSLARTEDLTEKALGFVGASGEIKPVQKAAKEVSDSLLSEARKYKSAEEFVNSKIKNTQKALPVYRGTVGQGEIKKVIQGKQNYNLYEGGFWSKDLQDAKEYATGKSLAIGSNTFSPKGGGNYIIEGRMFEDSTIVPIKIIDANTGKIVQDLEKNSKSQLTSMWNEANKGMKEIVKDPVESLTEVLNKFKPLRGKQEELYSAERGARFGKAEQAQTSIGGEAGFKIALGKLKGELPKVDVSEKLKNEVRKVLSQEQIDTLFTKIQTNKWMTTGEKVSTQSGLAKTLSGQVPTEGELNALQTVFGNKLIDALKAAQPWKWDFWNVLNEAGGTMKVLLSSLGDLSFYARQGVYYATRKPIKGLKLIKEGAQSALNQKYYDAIQDSIRTHEYYPIARRFNLPFTEVGGLSTKLSEVDEQFLIRWIKKIPIFGNVVEGTERAFNAMANKARADWFYGIVDDLIKKGYNPMKDPEVFQRTATFIADATGRSNLGKVLNEASGLTNLLIYSPRLIASKVKMLVSPATYLTAPTPLRNEVWRTALQYYSTVSTIIGIMALNGAEVETDPRSTDFLKIKYDNRRWDITGGLQPYLRFIAQMVTGKTKKTTTGEVVDANRLELLGKIGESKLSPLASAVKELLAGKDFLGQDITAGKFIKDHFVNLVAQDVWDAAQEVGWPNAFLTTGVPSFLGIGAQTYLPQETESKTTNYAKKRTNTLPSGFKTKNYAK